MTHLGHNSAAFRLRKMKRDDRAEMEAILDTYNAALGPV